MTVETVRSLSNRPLLPPAGLPSEGRTVYAQPRLHPDVSLLQIFPGGAVKQMHDDAAEGEGDILTGGGDKVR